jgi:hypothetical protein
MSDGSREHTRRRQRDFDLGDRYSYLCLLDAEGGEVLEEGPLLGRRLRATRQRPSLRDRRRRLEKRLHEELRGTVNAPTAPGFQAIVPMTMVPLVREAD